MTTLSSSPDLRLCIKWHSFGNSNKQFCFTFLAFNIFVFCFFLSFVKISDWTYSVWLFSKVRVPSMCVYCFPGFAVPSTVRYGTTTRPRAPLYLITRSGYCPTLSTNSTSLSGKPKIPLWSSSKIITVAKLGDVSTAGCEQFFKLKRQISSFLFVQIYSLSKLLSKLPPIQISNFATLTMLTWMCRLFASFKKSNETEIMFKSTIFYMNKSRLSDTCFYKEVGTAH